MGIDKTVPEYRYWDHRPTRNQSFSEGTNGLIQFPGMHTNREQRQLAEPTAFRARLMTQEQAACHTGYAKEFQQLKQNRKEINWKSVKFPDKTLIAQLLKVMANAYDVKHLHQALTRISRTHANPKT
jgi:hypothetical protein